MSVLGALAIAGGLSALSTGLTMGFNSHQAQIDRSFQAEQNKLDREFSALEAQKNRDWQENLSNTAYQRTFADMKKAGLNPYSIFSNSGMNVATTPAGASSTASRGVSGSRASIQFNGGLASQIVRSAFDLAKYDLAMSNL